MEFKTLGRTGTKIPVIGIGTWGIGGYVVPDYARDEECVEALKYGIELGMTLIDTAEVYGVGHSEEIVGRAIRGKRDEVFVATKVSPEHLKYDDVVKAAERSLRRLGTTYIDLYQIHAPNPSIPIKETMRAMEHLVDLGKVRYIGVSNFPLELLKEAQYALSKYEIVSNQVLYNLEDRGIEIDLLPYAQKERITIIAYSPLRRGSLLTPGRRSYEILSRVALALGKTPGQVALNWLILKDPVVAIPKATSFDHLTENAGACGWCIPREHLAELDRIGRRRWW